LGLQRDTIADFAKGSDDVVLTSIDANTAVSGHQTFTLDAGGTFSAGEIRQTQVGANLPRRDEHGRRRGRRDVDPAQQRRRLPRRWRLPSRRRGTGRHQPPR
jgi:hypothetical protein